MPRTKEPEVPKGECVCCKKKMPMGLLEPPDKCYICGGDHLCCASCAFRAKKLNFTEVKESRVRWKQCPVDGSIAVMLEIANIQLEE